jgi:ubiquinone/menaquinone biosynthesis C-methylase UbiE
VNTRTLYERDADRKKFIGGTTMKQNIYDNDQFFEGYKKLRDTSSGLNDVLEQPAIKKLLPELKDLKILEIGCGMGEFSKYCIDNGAASITATDISKKMLEAALHKNNHPRITYINKAIEDLDVEACSFDLVVSSLALHYVEEYQSAMKKVFSWLKPNGQFIFSIEHPIVLAQNSMMGWIEKRLYWAVDNYGDEGIRKQNWYIEGVVKYHRKISTLLNGLIHEGFRIDYIDEPEAVQEALLHKPDLYQERRRPPFLIVKSSKC